MIQGNLPLLLAMNLHLKPMLRVEIFTGMLFLIHLRPQLDLGQELIP